MGYLCFSEKESVRFHMSFIYLLSHRLLTREEKLLMGFFYPNIMDPCTLHESQSGNIKCTTVYRGDFLSSIKVEHMLAGDDL